MTDMQAALAGGITRRILVATGHGGPVGRALAAQGVELPATVLPSAGKVAGIPPEVLPVTVHKDLSSAVGVLLQCGWRPGPGGPQYPYSSGSSDGC